MNTRGLLPAYHAARIVEARAILRWIITCIVIMGATIAGSAAFILTTPGPDPAVLSQIDEARARIADADANAGTWRAKAGTALRDLQGRKAVGEHPDWGLLLDRVVAAGGSTIAVEEFSVAFGTVPVTGADADKKPKRPRWTVTVSGLAPTQSAVVKLVSTMEGWKLFDRVRLIEAKARAVRTIDAVSFKVEAVIEEPPR